jgi:hypothetical protein
VAARYNSVTIEKMQPRGQPRCKTLPTNGFFPGFSRCSAAKRDAAAFFRHVQGKKKYLKSLYAVGSGQCDSCSLSITS